MEKSIADNTGEQMLKMRLIHDAMISNYKILLSLYTCCHVANIVYYYSMKLMFTLIMSHMKFINEIHHSQLVRK